MHSVLICDTPSNDGQQCYQVSSISIKAFKSYGPDTICTDRQTDRWTDGRTDGQTKWFLYTPWISFVGGNGTSSLTKFVTLNFCTYAFRYYLRHTFSWWTTMLPGIINIHRGIQKLWTEHDLHRQTDGRTDKVIPIYPPPWTSFVGGIMSKLV